ncbi:Protein serine/threonine kinase [Entamoeba marina]
MLYLLCFICFINVGLSQSYCLYQESLTSNSVVYNYVNNYEGDSGNCVSGVTYSSGYVYGFLTEDDVEEMIIDTRESDSSCALTNSFNVSMVNLQYIRCKYSESFNHYLILENTNNDMNIVIGCFGETGCGKSSYPRIFIYLNNVMIFSDVMDGKIGLELHESCSIENYYDYPFAYVGSSKTQILSPRVVVYSNSNNWTSIRNELLPYHGKLYLFTGSNIDIDPLLYTSLSLINYAQLTSSYVLDVCHRKNTGRYVFVNPSYSTFSNCSCWSVHNETSISTTTIFNYPDCKYNSTLFDFVLTTNEITYSFNEELLSWYSIIFTKSSQSIDIANNSTISLDVLNLNQNDISINGNIYVEQLRITIAGALLTVVDFELLNTKSIGDEGALFYYESSPNTNFSEFGLITCHSMAIKTFKTNCSCLFNGVDFGDESESKSCNTLKIQKLNQFSLILSTSSYSIDVDEFWYEIVFGDDTLQLNGSKSISLISCDFRNKTITIEGHLSCSTMIINSNTQVNVNGQLSVNTLKIFDQFVNNLNENGFILSHGISKIENMEIDSSQSNCFELVSSSYSFSSKPTTITTGYSSLLLSQNHLLRICPFSKENNNVICTTTGNTFDYTLFDSLHCPCIDENCIINVTTTQLDSRNVGFNGIFNVLTNSTIAISYKTLLFKIIYDVQNYVLLVGSGAVGFNKYNTNSLKSETTTSIESSNQLDCKALLLTNIGETCLIEKNTIYPIDGDINNCKLQNGFGCETCYEGYESNVTYCNECPSNCLRCYTGYCINCEMNYQLNETNKCELISDPIISFNNNKTMKCNDGFYSNTNECLTCSDSNCITCNSSQCLTCNGLILNNGECQSLEIYSEETVSNYGVISCNYAYYSNNSKCEFCVSTFSNCNSCNINGCLICSDGVIIDDGSCSLNTNCLNIEDSKCLSCNDKGSWFNGNECIECGDNCKNCINGYCIECNDGYILQNENNCIENVYPDNCITLSYYGTCQRCSDGYYLKNNLCYECSNECTTCYNLTYCFGCNDGYMLNDNNECVDMNELNANCKNAIPGSSGGCAICNDGYYRDQTTCISCISNCNKCYNGESCLSCESNYFLLNDASECISYDDLTNCETKTQSGCSKCNSSYYLDNQYCTLCSDTIRNCNTCNNNGECLTCQNDYILINYKCIHYQLIDNCKESSDSKCSSCSFWHTLNEDQTGCDKQVVWWVIVLIILFILMIFIGICALILYVTKQLFDWRKHQKQREETTIFDMKTSNIQFKSTTNKSIVINKDKLLFNDECEEIEVNEETRDLICVGNTSKHTIKVQFSVKKGCDKYEIRTNPQLITIPKGKACEFEIFIKPLCTCKINDQVMLISVDLSKGKTITTPINVDTITIITTRLDYSELIEDIKLGEGSFGIVYKGTFRGNQVAIKKMKNVNNNEEAIEEFNKEVTMLDKFRNEYIVHFYGAVFIPTKICMVTEFAQYGSLQDLIDKRKKEPIDNTIKMKILLDCSKGIEYLHSNGILHRDIKPDNFLVLSLDTSVQVYAKLTDFGSSRTINMLMTNMTFTKGIGTPVYMAPEVLNGGKYKKSADIYSFAITLYETMIWDEAYPNTDKKFKFPWKVAEFVMKGERLPKPDTMNESIYLLITSCWKQEAKERYSIEDVIKKLEEMN